MKGIILTAGMGTRLYPATKMINKGLLPLYDKPMVYYPLSTLMLAGIKDILIISTPKDIHRFEELLDDGSFLGIKISYDIQKESKGIADCFIIAEEFIGNDSVCLILGDNIFYGNHFGTVLRQTAKEVEENNISTIFGYNVSDPERFGVVEFDDELNAISIEEKPVKPKSNFAVVGLYFYSNSVVDIAKKIKPSKRGELEITSVNEEYLKQNNLKVKLLRRGNAWLDTGTHDTVIDASIFLRMVEQRQGLKISCPEEIAYYMKYISRNELLKISKKYNNEYGKYLSKVIDNDPRKD
tara:strand:+ start:139 stop:1026 length:888 start_codon:yes stop_codon:yes gene_type:complete